MVGGIYCFNHKLDAMVDVISKKCLHHGCDIRPNFNYFDEISPIYCFIHKLDRMVDVKHLKCKFDGCNVRPNFNYSDQNIGLYCVNHKLENMIDVVHSSCNTINCNIRNDGKNRGYCFRCFTDLFPDEIIVRNYRVKELSVVNFVRTAFSNFNWICNQRIVGGISLRRPDMLLDLITHSIIIEIDENKHGCYSDEDEVKRLFEIQRDLNGKKIVVIRFNPDSYTNSLGIKIKSCWKYLEDGTITIKKDMIGEWNNRLIFLSNFIYQYGSKENIDNIVIYKLFFDEKKIDLCDSFSGMSL